MSIDDKPLDERERAVWVQFAAAVLPACVTEYPASHETALAEGVARYADAMLAEYRKRA